jgi:DNA-binding HxlR family transcriptional regulator
MGAEKGYGQYCPLAMASEMLGNKWTMLVIRELLDGSTSFNDISRGLPLASRSLLARRLRDLEQSGLLEHRAGTRGKSGAYRLTEAGKALSSVVRAMAIWGQEWIDEEPSLENIDVRFLMWDMRRNVQPASFLPDPFTVQFIFTDAPDGLTDHWLVFEEDDIDLCYVDPGYEIDAFVQTDLRTMTRVWMGWYDLDVAMNEGALEITAEARIVKRSRDWLGLSGLSGVSKRPWENRVGRAGRT